MFKIFGSTIPSWIVYLLICWSFLVWIPLAILMPHDLSWGSIWSKK